METNGVDVDRIEEKARRVLAGVSEYVWGGESLPVPVDEIVADEFGLLVRLVEDLSTAPGCENIPPDKLSGLLLTGPGEIWVNATEASRWEGRRRFTISHELGHYVMHQDVGPRIFCRSIVEGTEASAQSDPEPGGEDGNVSGVEPAPEADPETRLTGGARSVPELEANAFAAALMMPRHLVIEQYEQHGQNISYLCEKFGASEKATRYRLDAMKAWD